MQDEEIIRGLKTGGLAEQNSLRYLYRHFFEGVRKYVLHNSGSVDEANDVFQDAMVVLYENVKQQKFNGESSLKTYLFSICRFLWFKKLKHEKRIGNELPEDIDIEEIPNVSLADRDLQHLANQALAQLKEDCRQVLKLTIYENLDMGKVAMIMNYKSEQIARNKKFKCLKSLKEKLKAQPRLRQELKTAMENLQ